MNRVPVQMILTGNPGGVGQYWIAQRYGMIPFPARAKGDSLRTAGRRAPQDSCNSLKDHGQQVAAGARPGVSQTPAAKSAVPSFIRGMARRAIGWRSRARFSAEWSDRRHVVSLFPIPPYWLRFTSADWGSARPFCVLWWAVVSDDSRGHAVGRAGLLSRMVWRVGPERRLEAAARECHRRRVASLEVGEKITYRVIDPAQCSPATKAPSIAERLVNTPRWGPGRQQARRDRRRDGRMGHRPHALDRNCNVRDAETNAINWAAGVPMLYVFSTCKALTRTLPALQHDHRLAGGRRQRQRRIMRQTPHDTVVAEQAMDCREPGPAARSRPERRHAGRALGATEKADGRG